MVVMVMVVVEDGAICQDDQVIGDGSGTQKHPPKPTSTPQSLSLSGIALRGCVLPRPQLKTPWAPPPLGG
jgi:hypothetical protein